MFHQENVNYRFMCKIIEQNDDDSTLTSKNLGVEKKNIFDVKYAFVSQTYN